MRHGVYLCGDARLGIELLAQLAGETRGERLVGVALPARELPQAFQVDACLAPRDEKAAVALDDRRRYDDRLHAQLFAIGHTRHFGLRATHTSAPRSISA